jgi:PAS domain-containing protein
LRIILHDFNEKFVQASGIPDQIDLETLKQEYGAMHPQGVALYVIDSTNIIIASTETAEIGYDFSNVPDFSYELTHIYESKKAVLDITSANQHSGEMFKYGYISSYDHDYLLEVGITISDLFIPDHSRYASLDPNIITTPNSVFLFSKMAILAKDPEQGLLPLGIGEQVLPDFPERINYLSRAFSEKENFSIYLPEESKHINYYFIPYPAEDAPARSFSSEVLEVTTDLTLLYEEIFQNTLFFIILAIICDGVFIGMGLIIIKLVVHPINQIIDDIEIIANGEYDHKIKQTNGPEFDRLEDSITKMISAFQETNATLLEKNSSLHALVEASTHGIVTVDPHMRIHHFNQIFSDLWGLSEDAVYVGADGNELLRHCAYQTINPELFLSNSHMVLDSSDMAWSVHVYLLDGKIFQSSSSSITGPDGTYYGRIWEVSDITERVQREQELIVARNDVEEKNSLLSTLLEASTHGTISVDSLWCIRHFNKNFCEMWNLPEDVIYVGADGIEFLMSYCVPQTMDPDAFLSDLRVISGNQDQHFEGQIYMSDGKIFQSISSPIIGFNGTYYGRTWEITDITDDLVKQMELERAYADLIRKDVQLTLALAGGGEGLWTWDPSTELFTLTHEFACRSHLLCESQSLDSFISAIHPDEREECLKILREIAENVPAVGIEFEFRLQSNEGLWRWIMSRGIASYADDGVSVIVTGTFVDITERKMYERHLHETNRRMIILSQITRHDIMNQLTNAFAISVLISDEVSSDAYLEELLELMEQGLNTMRSQMEFSKDYQELGIHGATWQDVNACIEKGKRLLIRPPLELLVDNLPLIFADPLLEKVMYNLIENSLRHGERVTQIEVTFSIGENDSGILTFKDNGVGVLDEEKERIFDMSYGKNTGLGLFLTREILGLTDIKIRECGQFGQSAQFELMIPAGYWEWQSAIEDFHN